MSELSEATVMTILQINIATISRDLFIPETYLLSSLLS